LVTFPTLLGPFDQQTPSSKKKEERVWKLWCCGVFQVWPKGDENKGVSCTVALPFTWKSILRQKKNYENLNISPCKNMIFKKSSKRNQHPSRYYNSITNFKFQHKPKYHR
jgi:hypothetical protein